DTAPWDEIIPRSVGAELARPVEARPVPDGFVALSSIIRVTGPFAGAIRDAMDDAWIAPGYDDAAASPRSTSPPIVTIDGYVFRGPRLVTGGGHAGGSGILETKREIKELRELIAVDRETLRHLTGEASALEGAMSQATAAIAALNAEHHKQEK